MITDRETNTLYISALLKKKHSKFHQNLLYKLNSVGVTPNYLNNTNDIWCRDFMPIQKHKNFFIQFKYEPSYLSGEKYKEIKTIPKDVWNELGIKVWESDIVLDGGNVVKWEDKVIVTERISKDNPQINENGLYEMIKRELGVNQLIVIPELKDEMTGHSDGIVRFIDSDYVVINDFSKIDREYSRSLKYCLLNSGMKYIEMPNEFELARDSYDATGDYINFLEMKDFVIIPAYGCKTDDLALMVYREIFKNKQVLNIECKEITKGGGALNCITWNIKV